MKLESNKPRVLLKEKHGVRVFRASTGDELRKSCLKIYLQKQLKLG